MLEESNMEFDEFTGTLCMEDLRDMEPCVTVDFGGVGSVETYIWYSSKLYFE